MIIREKYLEQLRNLRDVNVIKVITGIRRAGKTTLFKQFQTELIAAGVKQKNIIYLNLEELENAPLLNAFILNAYIMKMVDKKQKNYVFSDEIKSVQNLTLKILYDLCLILLATPFLLIKLLIQ